jgi:Protein of unknown function (DUF3017)
MTGAPDEAREPEEAREPDEAREPHIVPPESVPPVSAEELVDGVRPDPDDEEDERRYPSTIGGAFYLLVLATCIVGVVVVVTGEWRTGVRVFGGALLLGSLVRLLLSNRDAGMLAVRSKALDVLMLAALGSALVFLAGSIPDQPGV